MCTKKVHHVLWLTGRREAAHARGQAEADKGNPRYQRSGHCEMVRVKTGWEAGSRPKRAMENEEMVRATKGAYDERPLHVE